MVALTLLCLLISSAAVYALFRNNAVFRYRLALSRRWYDDALAGNRYEHPFERLPTYQQMLWRFWVWPLARFDKPLSVPKECTPCTHYQEGRCTFFVGTLGPPYGRECVGFIESESIGGGGGGSDALALKYRKWTFKAEKRP